MQWGTHGRVSSRKVTGVVRATSVWRKSRSSRHFSNHAPTSTCPVTEVNKHKRSMSIELQVDKGREETQEGH
jgi:hypothetical protein